MASNVQKPTSHPTGTKSLSGEDKVVILFSLLGFLGSVVLFELGMPSIMIAVFLSAGITSLAYRFLGGIKDTTLTLGAVKMTGAIAALVAIAIWMNDSGQLDPQARFHVSSVNALAGSWNWKSVAPNMGIDGNLQFTQSGSRLTFTGEEYKVQPGPSGASYVPFFKMTNGEATLSPDKTAISLESDVQEFEYGRTFHWKSTKPLVLIPAFSGELWPIRPGDPNLESRPWGILITKQ